MNRVVLHTIGQTPRPDLTPFIMAALEVPDIVVTGALDGLSAADLPPVAPGDFPLETRLSDGTRVEVGAAFLQPLIQQRIREQEAAGVPNQVHLVLCAGPFPDLRAEGELIRPFEYACETFSARGWSRPLVLVPFEGQVALAREKWVRAGFAPLLRAMDARPADAAADRWLIEVGRDPAALDCDVFVLDYVGYPRTILNRIGAELDIPVVDLGHLATDHTRDLLDEMSGRGPKG